MGGRLSPVDPQAIRALTATQPSNQETEAYPLDIPTKHCRLWDMSDREDDKFLTIRVPVADHKALAELAKRNERTIAAEVRLAIRAALEGERTAA